VPLLMLQINNTAVSAARYISRLAKAAAHEAHNAAHAVSTPQWRQTQRQAELKKQEVRAASIVQHLLVKPVKPGRHPTLAHVVPPVKSRQHYTHQYCPRPAWSNSAHAGDAPDRVAGAAALARQRAVISGAAMLMEGAASQAPPPSHDASGAAGVLAGHSLQGRTSSTKQDGGSTPEEPLSPRSTHSRHSARSGGSSPARGRTRLGQMGQGYGQLVYDHDHGQEEDRCRALEVVNRTGGDGTLPPATSGGNQQGHGSEGASQHMGDVNTEYAASQAGSVEPAAHTSPAPSQVSYIGDEVDPGSSNTITKHYTAGVTWADHTEAGSQTGKQQAGVEQGPQAARTGSGSRCAATGTPQAPVLVHRNPAALHHNLPTRGLDIRQARKVWRGIRKA
jgi:hypothetical protein